MKIYKKIILLVFLLYFINVFGQIGDDQFRVQFPNYAPLTPNAISLGKFGAFPPVNNLGVTNIDIPLYTIKQGDIEVPISISYNATSGIRVNDEASWVGLGWTLNAGGAIVRSVQGQPGDENILDLSGILDFNTVNAEYLLDVSKGWIDTANDVYFYNVLGNTGKFIYDQNLNDFFFFSHKPIKIQTFNNGVIDNFSGYNFRAILDNGTQLEFNESDKIDIWGNSTLLFKYRRYRTASYLTKITSKNKIDSITFNYENKEISLDKEVVGDYYDIRSSIAANSIDDAIPTITSPGTSYEKILQKINFDNGFVVFDYSFDRVDSDRPKLNNISIYSKNVSNFNLNYKLIKKITFTYDYYQRSGGKTYSTWIPWYNSEHYNKSLRLERISIYSNNSDPQIYSFEYNQTHLPIRNSSGQDFWGYPNNNNGTFVHQAVRTLYYPFSPLEYSSEAEIGTGNRNADEQKMKAGILEKIIYPTGGYSVFEYEANNTFKTETLPNYDYHIEIVTSEGGGSTGCGNSGLETRTFTINNNVIIEDAKLHFYFSNALGGNADQSYGEFHGVNNNIRRQRGYDGGNSYPEVDYDIDIDLSSGGTYTITAYEQGIGANGASGCPFTQTTVSWKELNGYTTHTYKYYTGGLHLKSITNYDGVQPNFTSKKEFEYMGIKELSPIKIEDYQTLSFSRRVDYCNYSDHPRAHNLITSTPSYSLNLNGGPSVEYTKIIEREKDYNDNDKGKIIYEYEPTVTYNILDPSQDPFFKLFKSPSSGVSSDIQLLQDHAYGNFKNFITKTWTSGSLKKISYYKKLGNNQYLPIKTIENNYQKINEKVIKYNLVFDIISWESIIPYGVNADGHPCALVIVPDIYDGCFIYKTGHYSLGKKLLKSSVEKLYNSDGQSYVETKIFYEYNNPDYFITEKKIIDSENRQIKENFLYPQDMMRFSNLSSDQIDALNNLLLNHRIATPIEITKTLDNKKIETVRKNYKIWGNNINEIESIVTSKGENNLESKITYHDYDPYGNPVELSKADGTHIYYIWGYNHSQPIAEIKNFSSNDIDSTIQNLIDEAVTASNSDIDDTSENTLRQKLNNLRNALPDNTQMTSYTYDLLIGVTSITEPNGNVTYYKYDSFNRLHQIVDKDGHILKEYNYHYKTN